MIELLELLHKNFELAIPIDSPLLLAAVDICNAALGYLSTGINNKSLTAAASTKQILDDSAEFYSNDFRLALI